MRRNSLLLIVGGLLLVLISGVAWASVRMNSAGGYTLVYPISRTSEIDVNLWPAASGLRVVIWHQDIDGATNTHLAAFTLRLDELQSSEPVRPART